ncbi:MAG: hypothetical protein HOV94_10955 [Saccharothrix sp.]|nr:hypothetical protein [Saccharothrix sp.]
MLAVPIEVPSRAASWLVLCIRRSARRQSARVRPSSATRRAAESGVCLVGSAAGYTSTGVRSGSISVTGVLSQNNEGVSVSPRPASRTVRVAG